MTENDGDDGLGSTEEDARQGAKGRRERELDTARRNRARDGCTVKPTLEIMMRVRERKECGGEPNLFGGGCAGDAKRGRRARAKAKFLARRCVRKISPIHHRLGARARFRNPPQVFSEPSIRCRRPVDERAEGKRDTDERACRARAHVRYAIRVQTQSPRQRQSRRSRVGVADGRRRHQQRRRYPRHRARHRERREPSSHRLDVVSSAPTRESNRRDVRARHARCPDASERQTRRRRRRHDR